MRENVILDAGAAIDAIVDQLEGIINAIAR